MRVVALRGVCIGVNRHLLPGEAGDVDDAQFKFLESIGAVEKATEPMPTESSQAPLPKGGKKEI